jgi:hydrogenase-4 component D
MQSLMISIIGIPFLGTVLAIIVRDRVAKYVAATASLLTALVAILLAQMPGDVYLFGSMPWLGVPAVIGFFGCQLDALAVVMLLASTIIGTGIVFFSIGYMSASNRDHPVKSGFARYYFWLMLFIGSMVGISISPTLLQLFIFWEITTLCSWALISFYDDEGSLKAGFKALIMTSIGSLFFFGGVIWVLAEVGHLRFSALGEMPPSTRAVAFTVFLIAAWAKSAQIPFHTWLPDAMAAPTPISAFLHAAAMVKAGVFLIARLLLGGWSTSVGVGLLVSIGALVTMYAALYLYFFQDDLKRLLAYSTIAQLGYIFLGIGLGALGSSMALRGAVLHVLMHAVAKTTLFLSVGTVAYVTGTRSISKLSGIVRTVPLAAWGFFIGAFALTGIPPLACFWSKIYVLIGAIRIPGAFGPTVVILLLVESLITFAWFLWVGQKVFLGKLSKISLYGDSVPVSDEILPQPAALPRAMELVLLLLMIACLLVPIAGIPLVHKLL